MKNSAFKQNLEYIQYDDVIKLREIKSQHELNLDKLNIPLKTANEYVVVMQDFLESLGFNTDRIEKFESRSRDGFIPHSHNKGGIEAITYRDVNSCCQDTGFEKTDSVLSKYADYNLKDFAENNKLDVLTYGNWTDEQRELYYEYENESDDTVQFQARIMFTSETSANIDFYVSASDTPYHRKSDDKLELDVNFKSPAGLKRKLASILKNEFVGRFSANVKEGF